MKSVILFVCLIFPIFAFSGEKNCGAVTSTLGFDLCVNQAHKTADSRLNVSYKQLIARVKSQYQKTPEQGARFLVRLKVSQLAWLKLRDANCAIEAFEYDEEMPAYEVTVNICVTKISLERSEYLDNTFPDNYNAPKK